MAEEQRSRPAGNRAADTLRDDASVGDPADSGEHARFCWRCYASIDTARPVPVCDDCEHHRDERRQRMERRAAVKARSDVRPDTRSLIVKARRAAEAQMPWRARRPRWWEVAR